MQYWKINEDGRIEALVDFWDIKKGQVGGHVDVELVAVPDASLPLWIGNFVELGNSVKLGDDVKLGNFVALNTDSFIQLLSHGFKSRTVIFHLKNGYCHVSIGCQCSIPFDKFIDRTNNATETSQESADFYKQWIPVYEKIKNTLEENAK